MSTTTPLGSADELDPVRRSALARLRSALSPDAEVAVDRPAGPRRPTTARAG